jgi:hypothetical protein
MQLIVIHVIAQLEALELFVRTEEYPGMSNHPGPE